MIEWSADQRTAFVAFIAGGNFAYATDEKILLLADRFADEAFDEVMEAVGYAIDQPGERKPLPQVGEIRMRIIEQRQLDRQREASQRRNELPPHRRAGMPWFSRLQLERTRAGLAPGLPLEEDPQLVRADCERFGIHRDTLEGIG